MKENTLSLFHPSSLIPPPLHALESAMLDTMIGQKVVVDLRSTFVCLGTLSRVDDHYLELKNADLHDLRDGQSSRENYVAAALTAGVKRNRKKLLLSQSDLVAISRQEDVVTV